MSQVVQGPAWTSPGTGRYAGRYPLAVERHTLAQVDRLLPGVTTVTPHGRYYALHALVAAEAARRGLADLEARTLLRRTEVVCAAVSIAHESADNHRGLGRAHGADAVAHASNNDLVDVDTAAGHGHGRYAKAEWGYLGPYRGAEIMIGALAPDEFRPGPNYSAPQVEPSFEGIFDLAAQSSLSAKDLRASHRLCVCAGASAPDGEWLSRLLAAPGEDSRRTLASTRRQTIQLVTRALELAPTRSVGRDLPQTVAFGGTADEDPVLKALDVTRAWRGTILRAESVAAWRSLWAWLVSQIEGLTPRSHLGDLLAEQLPSVKVGGFAEGLPSLRDAQGHLAPAERDPSVQELKGPARSLAVLFVGGLRTEDLDSETLVGMQGRTTQETHQQLAPMWVRHQMSEWANRSMQDFGRQLSELLLDRAQRIAFRKATRSKATGMLKVPTRVYLRDDLVFKDSDEGAGGVALRWDQLTTVLAEAGVLALDGVWTVTDRGRDVLT